jgi:hypothetical protein
MATEEMVMDVSQDRMLACDVQQGFMQVPRTFGQMVPCISSRRVARRWQRCGVI